ncbi:protein of unknown function [Tepidibacter aestuarii]|nr:protein of unknown function [Tepidibacter aestuarii]
MGHMYRFETSGKSYRNDKCINMKQKGMIEFNHTFFIYKKSIFININYIL